MNVPRRLTILAGALLALAPASAAGVTGSTGHYKGHDDAGHEIRFGYAHGRVSQFTVGSDVFVAQGLSSGNHHVTIEWRNATHAAGTYSYYVRRSDQYVKVVRRWTAHKLVPAHTPKVDDPARGAYQGTDDRGRGVTFSFDGRLRDFVLGTVWGNREANVSHGLFKDAEGNHELEGGWTDRTHVAGIYSYYRQVRGELIHVTIKWNAKRAG